MKKKAISPIIGEVILIVISISLAVIVFLWGKSFTQSAQKGFSEQTFCKDVSFLAGNICYDNAVQDSKPGKKIEFYAINYSPNISLSGFRVSLKYEGGMKTTDINSLLEVSQSQNMISDFIDFSGIIKQVVISPMIKNGKDNTACTDKATIFSGQDINPCA